MFTPARKLLPLTPLLGVALSFAAWAEVQGPLDPDPVWPLCGRINESPPPGWQHDHGCPAERWGSPDFTDTPISSTYGPRLLFSEGLRYDFHRGIDIACPVGTPVFAFANGVVRKAGPDPAYSDPLVQLRHYRPDHWGQCNEGGGCYHTNYLHMSGWTVDVDDVVAKGELIGYSGASGSGFAHVHFEIRDAAPQDPYSSWQRDTIHPLTGLAYPDQGAANLQLVLEPVDAGNPLTPQVFATVTIPMSVELDLERVEVELYERQVDHSMMRIAQPGDLPVGHTVEEAGYWVDPTWFSMHTWNRQYTYKNSTSVPWSSFELGGVYESPFWDVLPGSYDPHVHLDAQHPEDFQVGLFNGVSIAPNHTNASSSEYVVRFGFHALHGAGSAADLCVRVRALDVRGNATAWATDGCTPPRLALTLDTAALLWNAADLAGGYDVVHGDVDGLRSSGGDFSQATLECLASAIPQTSQLLGTNPSPGQAFWYLVRPVLGTPLQSYDSGGVAQMGSRDTGIAASGNDCP
jgi:hypothetical protein